MMRFRHSLPSAAFALMAAFALAGCAGMSLPSFPSIPGFGSSEPTPPPPSAPMPSVRPDDIVGRWGLASFQKPEDRARTEAAARTQCSQPYTIAKGPSGGVMMHLYDNPRIQELSIRAAVGGATFIGPAGEAAGGANDREVVSFDGRSIVLRWVDPEVAGRYGTMIYVRCAPRA